MAMTDKELEKILDKRRFTTSTKTANRSLVVLLRACFIASDHIETQKRLTKVFRAIDGNAQRDRALAWLNSYVIAATGAEFATHPVYLHIANDKQVYVRCAEVLADSEFKYQDKADKFAEDYPNPMSWKGEVAKIPKSKEFNPQSYANTVAKHFLENGVSEAAAISALKAAFTHQLDTHSNKPANENKFLDDTEISSSVRTLQGGLPTLGKRR